MDQTLVAHTLLLYVLFFNGVIEVQSQRPTPEQGDAVSNFEPSLAVVIGILFIMFSITFFLLIFAKFHRRSSNLPLAAGGGAFTRSRRFSGIDKKLIESLPFFRFSTLKGSREGLECAVCLSKFEDVEILRLLPKCKHAFHIECIDNWLEHHSTCPLCRQKVGPDDLRVSNEMRLEMLIEREEEEDDGPRSSSHGSLRFGSSFRKIFSKGISLTNNYKDEENPTKEILFHKYNHRIVVSDVVYKNRWSNVSSSDIMFLNTEMLGALSSDRFVQVEGNPNTGGEMLKTKEEMERRRLWSANSKALCSSEMVGSSKEKRSQSEITGVSRFTHLKMKDGSDEEEDRRRQLWFPIARRTVQWFANRERTSDKNSNSNDQEEELDV